VSRGGGGEGVGVVAFVTFNALSIGVADVRFLANASRRAIAQQAFPGYLRSTVNQVWQRHVAAGQAVQLGATFAEDFAITGALSLWLHGRLVQGDVDGAGGFAVGSSHADAVSVFQVSFLAEAADDALSSADRARLGVSAGGWAGGTARVEDFVFTAFRDWWEHHERRHWWDRVDLRALEGHDAASIVGTDVSLFAGATRFADAWAGWVRGLAGSIATFALTVFFVVAAHFSRWQQHFLGALAGQNAATIFADVSFFAGAALDADEGAHWVGVLAGSVAAFALAEFFIFTAHLRWQRHGFGSWHTAEFRVNALAFFVFQVAGFAEAADHALKRAYLAGMGVGAGWGAGGTARHEDFVFFALRNFWWVGEEHGCFGGFALAGFNAQAVGISQVSLLAKASNDAVLCADGAGMGFGAGRGAG